MSYLFLDLDKDGYEFFIGDRYSSGDVFDVKNGELAIIDLQELKILIVDDDKNEDWFPIEVSKVRSFTFLDERRKKISEKIKQQKNQRRSRRNKMSFNY